MKHTKLCSRILHGIWPVIVGLALGVGSTAIANAQSEGPVRFAENDWTNQLVDTHLAKIILEEHMGYDVELVFTQYSAEWAGLAAGDLDVAMEIWPSYNADAQKEWIEDKKKVEVIGDLGVIAETGWYVPTYVIEGDSERGIEPMAPDLKSYEDLNKYAKLFARPETGDEGFFLDAVASWEGHNEERIANLGVNFVNVFAGTEGALLAELESAYAKGEPIIMYGWKPHWMHTKYDLTEIELPPYSDQCYGIGTDEKGTFACDWPSEALYNVARAGFKDEYPEVHRFLRNLRLTNEEQGRMVYLADVEGKSVEEAVRTWMADNEDIWRSWIPE